MDFYFDYDLGEFYENGEAGLPKDMGIALKLYTNPGSPVKPCVYPKIIDSL